MKRTLPSLVLIGALGLNGCLATNASSLDNRNEATATVSKPERAWEVRENGELVGIVVQFVELGGGRAFHSVRNPDHQELGLIDELGRAWYYRPHAPEPDWLITGTVFDGVRAILRLGPGARSLEVPVATLAPKKP